MDYPIHIDTFSLEQLILYFKGCSYFIEFIKQVEEKR